MSNLSEFLSDIAFYGPIVSFSLLAIIYYVLCISWKEKENMRVYIKKEEPKFRYPEDMEKILTYLREHGEVKVSDKTIEQFYEDFSDEEYCAGWMVVDDQMLEEFADWLNKKEI